MDRRSKRGNSFSSYSRSGNAIAIPAGGGTNGGRGGRVYRNGYYERDFETHFGTIRLRIARTREKSFLPSG